MNELKIGFSSMSHPRIAELAGRVHHALTHGPGLEYFPSPDPDMTKLRTANEALDIALSKETAPSSAALRQGCRDAVVKLLGRLAPNLELTADGNLVMLAATGFELRKRSGIRSEGPAATPANVRVYVTGISGQVLLKCKAVQNASNYEAQFSLSADGPWISIDLSSSSQRMLFKGLTRGKDYFFRVRAFTANGAGGWSDIATMMVV